MQNILSEESALTNTGYRLSPQQRQIWQEQQHYWPEDAANYCAQAVLAVHGNLEPDRLRAAVTDVVARHQILRTSFPRQSGMDTPMQVIHEEPAVAWREEDFSNDSSDTQQSLTDAVVKDETLMDAGFRIAIVRWSAEEWRVVLTMPALCADDVSLGLISKEIFKSYDMSSGELESMQYIKFSEWQHELAESEDSETGRAFWLEQRTSQSSAFSFANSPSGETGKRIRASLNRDVAIQLDRVAAECKLPTETVLLACWFVLIGRLTTQETLSVNCVVDGRQYEVLQDSIGVFARSLPLSSQFDEQQTFAEFAQQLEQRRRKAVEWQEYFEWQPEMAAAPGFEYVEHSRESMFAGSLEWRLLERRSDIHRPKFGLRCEKTDETIELELVSYVSGDFDFERLLPRMQMLVAAVVRDANQPIGKLPILDESEWNYLVHELSSSNQETAAEPQDFVRTFETMAERFATDTAVTGADEELTYGDLNRRANQLAHYLQRFGVTAETRVAICLDRSAKFVLALLGVLKAGGAYLPLDLIYSRKQLSFMLEDAAPPVLLTDQNLLAELPEYAGRTVCLDSEWETIAAESSDNPPQVWTAQNLAYVIYTSGSTGTPKGVEVERAQLQNYLRAVWPRLRLHDRASYAMVSTFAADLGNTAIFLSLSTGGRLHVVSRARATNPDAVAEYFSRHEIDCLKIPPSHLEALLEASTPAQILPRHCLVVGGEPLRRHLVAKIEELAPHCRIVNHYGPTEVTIGMSSYTVSEHEARPAVFPLGRPMVGTQVYLLDRNLAPVPLGVPARLFVGGKSVTRGYLNRPDLTAERYVPNPFGPAGTRLYDTGDVAYHLPDGNIAFVGRNDNQVKIHGFRVELGEIECALLQHESVREAAVITRGETAVDKHLAAYLVCGNNLIPTATELREFLMTRLAAHMIPSDFVLLNALPLNPNGKVDRRALPATEGISLELERPFVEPRNAVEEVLAAIWSSVLNQERVGAEDNFFELGGHSLAAMQVTARIRQVFQMELSLRAVFEATTLAELAQAIVDSEPEPGLAERIAGVWKKLEGMSPEEREALRGSFTNSAAN
jgi:amino acid adenylation domain-containing protein